ncbi:uncharacterized protein B0H18DRAFT_1003419 [Fomitopsis serialis]|uniref:uncharacterized protein n=1 Tax=Fomitopsis serialis TaxID=139415 RepID=UPI002008DE93|nr:uncharacterized protein B0H18DRAFT_1003419 [Neoantrodia serialis]KAH9927700.1 hypothetical protein B0H18DRAFT_1003419 [Neoantrodia serialis]
MSDDGVLSSVISIACIACLDVMAGVLTDLASVRHACTEHLCQCACKCGRHSDRLQADESSPFAPDECEPLIAASGQRTEPSPQPSMQVPGKS